MNRMVEGDRTSSNGGLVANQALQWFVRLRSGHATSADRRRFALWIRADARHQKEFEACSRLWGDLDAAKPLLGEELADMARDWEYTDQTSVREAGWGWNSARISALLAMVVAVVIAGGWWFGAGLEMAEYQTAKGERRTVFLPDGSMLTMNTGTAVRTEFSPLRRSVLVREGEVLVAVSHADRRRFEVLSGGRVIRDIGTQFVVRRQDQQVKVTVVEGAVEVQRFDGEAPEQSWQLLTAGQQLSYEQRGALSPVGHASLAAVTAWVDGKIIFEDRPLSEVLQEVGRYQSGEIRILDPRLAGLKVSGVFGVRDRAGLLVALERALPVAVSRVTADLAVLEEKKNSSLGQ